MIWLILTGLGFFIAGMSIGKITTTKSKKRVIDLYKAEHEKLYHEWRGQNVTIIGLQSENSSLRNELNKAGLVVKDTTDPHNKEQLVKKKRTRKKKTNRFDDI